MKKDDITNKSLATLLIVAIVISIGGTWLVLNKAPGLLNIAGAASTDTGTATVTINSVASIRFAYDAIDFGSGSVNTTSGNTLCILDTNGTNDSTKCQGFLANTSYFQLENDGSTNITVQLLSSKPASTFIGGTNPQFRYAVFENETTSCRNGTGGTGYVDQIGGGTGNCTATDGAGGNCTVSPRGWTDVNSTGVTGATICMRLGFADLSDSLGFDINLTIPYDAPAGAKTATFTATATTIV
ncbi:MAG: hypothetical protein AABY01_00055 [Nanoarchaeota archaeon]